MSRARTRRGEITPAEIASMILRAEHGRAFVRLVRGRVVEASVTTEGRPPGRGWVALGEVEAFQLLVKHRGREAVAFDQAEVVRAVGDSLRRHRWSGWRSA